MTPAIRQMTAAFVLPQLAAAEATARLGALWAGAVATMLRPRVVPAPAAALPAPGSLQGRLEAPEPMEASAAVEQVSEEPGAAPTRGEPAMGGGPDDGMVSAEKGDGGLEEAREVLAGAPPSREPSTIAAGPERAEETGGPTEDTATLVDGSAGPAGTRSDPDGAVS